MATKYGISWVQIPLYGIKLKVFHLKHMNMTDNVTDGRVVRAGALVT